MGPLWLIGMSFDSQLADMFESHLNYWRLSDLQQRTSDQVTKKSLEKAKSRSKIALNIAWASILTCNQTAEIILVLYKYQNKIE